MRSSGAAALALAGLLAACASVGPAAVRPGEPLDAVRQRLGPPSATHPREGGGERLEYGGGAFGTQTWMLDFDAQGRFVAGANARSRASFDRVRPGMTRDELLAQIGSPSRTWQVRYHDQTVLTYRFDNLFCEVFHVGVTPDGRVEDTGYGPDPLCEPQDIR